MGRCRPAWGHSPINDHLAMVEGLEYPIGLLLFFEGGYLTLLEGHATGDRDTLAVDFTMAVFGEITTDYLALRRE